KAHPGAAARARRHRTRAARQALRELRRLGDDHGGDRAAAYPTRYPRPRPHPTRVQPTPPQAQQHPLRPGLGDDLARRTAAILQACADCRFAPAEVARRRSLPAEAIELIEALEDTAC